MEQSRICLEEKKKVIVDFENTMRQTKHKHCVCCRRIRVKHDISISGMCGSCKKHKSRTHFLDNNGLPVWYEKGDRSKLPNYHLPPELSNLTLAEKMLIQRVSPFVALQHIRNGVMGLKEHVCAFEQEIDHLASHLPRPVSDLNIISVEQFVVTEIGSDRLQRKAFRVRRSKVITALYWLKNNNPEYFDITIDESQLDWIGDTDEGYVDVKQAPLPENEDDNTTSDLNRDNGPVPNDASDCAEHAFGYVDNGGRAQLSPDDEDISNALKETIGSSKQKRNINVTWPELSKTAVNEYSDMKVFVRAFPWLFPGGFGDPKDFPGTLGEWGSLMLFYEDARFAVDKIFTFFALNYIIRHRNSTSGGFFIDKFQQGCPDTLEDLKEKVQNGDTAFINSLTYYNKRVKGCNAYWHHKRSEVYSWINHHVEVGNGAPSFFITLSCAEHYWADVADLLKDRLKQAGLDSSQCKVGAPGFSTIVNDHTIVVQEYFQERVIQWLDTVGKTVFDIQHYWIRYEFTPGRGQIHAHLLAITNNQDMCKLVHDAKHDNSNDGYSDHLSREKIISDWAQEKFRLTASVADYFDDIEMDKETMPTTVRFMDLDKDNETHERDAQLLLKAVQHHTCSGFCMRKGKNKE